jgi:hypothetical protein
MCSDRRRRRNGRARPRRTRRRDLGARAWRGAALYPRAGLCRPGEGAFQEGGMSSGSFGRTWRGPQEMAFARNAEGRIPAAGAGHGGTSEKARCPFGVGDLRTWRKDGEPRCELKFTAARQDKRRLQGDANASQALGRCSPPTNRSGAAAGSLELKIWWSPG